MPLVQPPNTRPPQDVHRFDEVALARWLEDKIDGFPPSGTAVVRQFRGGQSNPTYWIGVEGGEAFVSELVLRKKPPGELLPSAHAIEREYRVLCALEQSDVPVPRALALCEDASVIGTPFFVMRYVAGRIFWDPKLPEVDEPAERRAIYEELVRVLAALHRVDYAAVGLGDYAKVGGYVERQVQRWARQYEASRTGEIPAMEALGAWLGKHVPAREEIVLTHGDFRLDNIIFDREGARALSIIDWELSTLGHPLSDLAYLCMVYHLIIPGHEGLLGADLEGLAIPGEAELVQMYCRQTGRAELDDFPYFMAFGLFRLAAIAQGVYKRSLQGNASSESAGMYGTAVHMLAELGCEFAEIRTTGAFAKT